MKEKDLQAISSGKSVFTGNPFALFGVIIASFFLSVLSFTIAWPWLYCWLVGWILKRTYIDGRQLRFDGKGSKIIGWWILCIVVAMASSFIFGRAAERKAAELSAAMYGYNSMLINPAPAINWWAFALVYVLMLGAYIMVLYLFIRWTVRNCHFVETEATGQTPDIMDSIEPIAGNKDAEGAERFGVSESGRTDDMLK